MNDPIKTIRYPGTNPGAPPGSSGKSMLKADLPSWETPAYLQEDAFPIPKDIPAPPERVKPLQEPAKNSPARKQAPSPQTKKASPDKKKASGKNRALYSDTAADGYIRRSIQSWFNTFMIMNIPIIGWIYLLILALGKKDQRKDFARAYLVYKLVFFLVALAIIAFFLYAGMEAADMLLQYINML